jgi:uncharacterized membrane protein
MHIPRVFRAPWFWYALLCVLLWAAWAFFSKLGSAEIPAIHMQFFFTLGTIPVALLVFAAARFRLELNARGTFYGTANGVLSGIGGMAFFAALRSGGNTSVVTTATGLYPMITVLLAVLVLRERLTAVQVVGLAFAAAAIVIFSL